MNTKNNFGPRYQVLELLSTGGMAHLYKATFTSEGFTRPVVIKKILEHYEHDPRWVESFFNEAKIMSLLNHSHIVQVYDFGKSRSGYFLAMEYVEGGSLLDLIRKARTLPEPVVLYSGLEILKGLSYAHKKGVLHRDISPSNILVSKAGEVKLTDFGVAKLQSASLEPTQFLKGKESYMSPEQRRREPLTYASDVYSLAVILRELLPKEIEADYLKRGLAERVEERVQTCEEFEGILLNEVKHRQCLMTQREFAQFLQGYGPWRSQKTLPLEKVTNIHVWVGGAEREAPSTRPQHLLRGRTMEIVFRRQDPEGYGWKKVSSLLVLLLMCFMFGAKSPAFSPKGYLTLNAKPWGEVYVGKTYVGTTPLIRTSLPTGKYTLTISNPLLKQTKKMAIAIEENQIIKEAIHF